MLPGLKPLDLPCGARALEGLVALFRRRRRIPFDDSRAASPLRPEERPAADRAA